MILNKNLKESLGKNKVLKIIIGLNNFNLNDIIDKTKIAEIGGATYIDIAANTHILHELKQISTLPICVSSIDANELFACFKAGADVLEIGNFDIFYNQGIVLSPDQVFNIAKKITSLAPLACICVTIPHYLCLSNQINLAQRLEFLGVDMIQTEGFSSKLSKNLCLINSLNRASSALSSTYVLAKYIKLPIISASGINPLSAQLAISYGASGVGIGTFMSQFNNLIDSSFTIESIIKSMSNNIIIDLNNKNFSIYPIFDSIHNNHN